MVDFNRSSRLFRRAAVMAAMAGSCACFAQGIVPGTAPGQRADQPQPGQPTPQRPAEPAGSPDFAPPQPNKGVPAAPAAGDQSERPQFLVGAIVIRYEFDHPELPAVDDLQKTEVTLGRTVDGYVSPAAGMSRETFAIEDIAMRPAMRFSAQAINIIGQTIANRINREGVLGVVVAPSEKEFTVAKLEESEKESEDLRRPGQTAVTLIVRALLVKELRTVAFGDRLPPENRINAPEHDWIRKHAPVQAYNPDDVRRQDLLRKDLLDEYVFRLNRHPGRRVDIAVAASDEATASDVRGLAVDLLVNENRPWFIYAQGSNTGTKQTNEWRERFGFVNNQLTGDDDILNLDYITSGFDSSHALIGSYERPLYEDWVRGRVFANWSQYTASDVGQTNEEFTGEAFTIGGELIANVYQHRELFIDLTAGLRFEHVETTNKTADTKGDADFLLPSFGARLERLTERAATAVSVNLEFNVEDVTDPANNPLAPLGRVAPDPDWVTLNWDVSQSIYLDPYIFGSSWTNTEEGKGHPTLAHELAASFRGQYAFDNRLIPNFEQVVGGLFTVRGYPESAAAGDTVLVGTLEYRLHVPQAFGYESQPGTLFGKPFRYVPQAPYGRADWDFIVKAFIDAGRSENSNRRVNERDHTLVGTGVGAEFLFKRYLTIRVDWGVALQDVKDAAGNNDVTAGSNRFHILATVLF